MSDIPTNGQAPPVEAGPEFTEAAPEQRRTRRHVDSLDIDREVIAKRVRKFHDDDISNRSQETKRRQQRYAKYRLWTEGRDYPWPDASDVALPDLTEKSLRVQDTLTNAVLQQERTVVSKARKPVDFDQQDKIDNLIHHQVFVENRGETMISEMAEEFVNEPSCTVFIPWVEERREVQEFLRFDPIPENMDPGAWFEQILTQHFGQALAGAQVDDPDDPWDWTLSLAGEDKPKAVEVSFYTDRSGDTEMWITQDAVVFDGPRPQVLDYDDVLYPADAANLQIPGPSNPDGASHVIVRSRPTVDEIRRLEKQGIYDLMDKEDLKKLPNAQSATTTAQQGSREQKSTIAGAGPVREPSREAVSHKRLLRLWCFDSIDIDGDGIAEDVVITMIHEPPIVLQVRRLTEMYPFNPPRRPFAEGSFLPVKGRKAGISLLEIGEGLHDAMKILIDQGIDSNTIGITPWGLYRPQGSINAETIVIEPGILHPSADPQRDLHIPQINNSAAQGFSLNMVTMLSTMEERVTMINDTSMGRVPAGSSSAMRTTGNMALLMGQGEARPERILRRFFFMLTEIWQQIHELNKRFLPREKQIRISGSADPKKPAYQEITNRSEINGRFDFEFGANAINMSKQAMQETLQQFGVAAFSPLMFQAGIAQADGLYRYVRDYGKALGIDPRRYVKAPSAAAEGPPITAGEAIAMILEGQMPAGTPGEPGGAFAHLQALEAFANTDEMGLLNGSETQIFAQWFKRIAEMAQQQAELAAAAQAQQQQQAGQPGRPQETAPTNGAESPPVSGSAELLDETLPGAGGGAQQ